jgi:hypothetical protein
MIPGTRLCNEIEANVILMTADCLLRVNKLLPCVAFIGLVRAMGWPCF